MTQNDDWTETQEALRRGAYGEWSEIRDEIIADIAEGHRQTEIETGAIYGISSSDVNHVAYDWVKSGRLRFTAKHLAAVLDSGQLTEQQTAAIGCELAAAVLRELPDGADATDAYVAALAIPEINSERAHRIPAAANPAPRRPMTDQEAAGYGPADPSISYGTPQKRSELITDRDEAIKAIRKALRKRSGKAWSVTGGRGTAWGWITIQAPPARREQFGYTSEAECEELAKLLGLDRVHNQGVSIPAGSDYRREYVARARGETPTAYGTPYWD